MHKAIRCLFLPKVLNGIRPEDIAHQAMSWWFVEAVDLVGIQKSTSGRNKQKLTARRSSRVFNSGESPPCMQRNCLFMMAARGSAQKDSMQASYTRSEYLCLPSNLSGNNSFMWPKINHTFQFEREVVGQMAAFVITTQ